MVHIKKHLERYHACTMCNEVFGTEVGLRWHRTRIHNVNVFRCRACGWKDFNYFVYEEHMKKHYDKSNYRCFDCDTGSNNQPKYKLVPHVQSHLTKTQNNLQCEICEKCFTPLQMNSHMKRHPNVGDSIKCEKCDYSCKTTNALIAHKELVHGYFQCNECAYVAQSKHRLCSHRQEKHKQNRVYVECRECRYFFVSTKAFQKHVSKVHSTLSWKDLAELKNTLECSICGTVKRNALALISHMLTHPEYRSKRYNNFDFYECKLCLLFYSSKSSFENHCTKVHCELRSCDLYDIKKQLKCSICGKMIDKLTFMNRHVKEHKSYKENRKSSEFIECSACHLFFASRKAFCTHVSQVHPSDAWQDFYQLRAELKCWLCGVVQKTIQAMNPHVASHGLKDKLESKACMRCKSCKFYYVTEVTFEAHVVKCHPDSSMEELIEYVDEMKCWVCGKVQVNKINSHIRSHRCVRPRHNSKKSVDN